MCLRHSSTHWKNTGLISLKRGLKTAEREPMKPERKKEVEGFLKKPDLLQRTKAL
jgi:hypothetical protein